MMFQIQADGFGGPEVLHREEVTARGLASDEVRVDVYAAGVNPADTYIRSGRYEFLVPELPFVPGLDGAGMIAEVGAKAGHLKPGDRVYVFTIPCRTVGTYTQSMICKARAVRPLPDAYSFAQGAAIGVPYTTAYRALIQRGAAHKGETVLIHGASGGVGIPTVQTAAAYGLTVIGTAGTPAGRDRVRDAGAHYVLDHTAPQYLDPVRDITAGRGVDIVVEMLANHNLQNDMTILAPRGRIVVVGSRGQAEIAPRTLMAAEADIRGTALWNMTDAEFDEAALFLDAHLAARVVQPQIGVTLPLADAAAAHETIMSERAAGRMILQCR